jgi:hypothetical protein
MFLTIIRRECYLPAGPVQQWIMLLEPGEPENNVMPSQWCDVKGEGLGVVSDSHLDLDLSVHVRKESAINIVDGEWISWFSDQCVFIYESWVYEISHGA